MRNKAFLYVPPQKSTWMNTPLHWGWGGLESPGERSVRCGIWLSSLLPGMCTRSHRGVSQLILFTRECILHECLPEKENGPLVKNSIEYYVQKETIFWWSILNTQFPDSLTSHLQMKRISYMAWLNWRFDCSFYDSGARRHFQSHWTL